MAYADGETALLEKVRGCDGFGVENTDRSNWLLLNSGKSDHYAILRRGEWRVEWLSLASYRTFYDTHIEIWQKYTDDAVTRTRLFEHAEAMFELMGYPRLGGIVDDAGIEGGGEPEEMWREGTNGPAWLRLQVKVTWYEIREVDFTE